MKICDLTQSYAETGGGVRTYLHAKRDHILRYTDHEHLLIIPGKEDRVVREGRKVTYWVASPPVPGSTVYRLLLRSGRVREILREERPEIIELHCAYNLPWAALRHRREHPCGIIGVYHTDLPSAYVEAPVAAVLGAGPARYAKAAAMRYVRTLYNRCDVTLAISPLVEAKLQATGVKRIEPLPLGVDVEQFHPSKRDPGLREMLGVTHEDLLLIYAGRLDREKRADLLCEAFERLPEGFPAVLVLVGDGPLRQTLSERGARSGRIRVLPFQTDRCALAGLLASADLYVSAMPFETFGLSVVEAQACGLPVVGVRAGAMEDRVPPSVGRLAPPDSPDGLAQEILFLAERPDLRREMGARARALVESCFSWRTTFEHLFKIYERL